MPEISLVIPTYNRREVLTEALRRLEAEGREGVPFEVVVVDDGSTDGTAESLADLQPPFPFRCLRQEHRGPAAARNRGIRAADAELILFLDSDLVPGQGLVAAHLEAHRQAARDPAGDRLIGHGPVIHVASLDEVERARPDVGDLSMAFFATGNVSVGRRHLLAAGLFDEAFAEYGWEDLELGLRLKQLGLVAQPVPAARGYHFKETFRVDHLPRACQRERERGHTAVLFFRKHPTWGVRTTTQLFGLTFWLDRLLARWAEDPRTWERLRQAEAAGRDRRVRVLARLITQHAYVQGLREGLAAKGASRVPSGDAAPDRSKAGEGEA
ncbi:glycosyltransferase family 2 protein [Limnochorda pilosa]|uniref:Family 2 glycosyl transferase n=1 Tax=Limnochorda pilosa TaxID=1555112 RepID=A0A0K2SP55_LIMPI|nr:glycosyltransferase [Limnochorda pilosa]BAS28886.1 family 2 glycosyl transferase [Limnochorda pilosa]